jgi:hypothetical protein
VKHTIEGEGDDDDFEDDEDRPEADDAGILWCPQCGSEMYGDATRCPSCGDYVTPGHSSPGSMPWWMWAIVILVGLALLAGMFASFR